MTGFDDILGQDAAVGYLRARLPEWPTAARDDLRRADRGVGKATCARAGRMVPLPSKADRRRGVCESCRALPGGNHPDYPHHHPRVDPLSRQDRQIRGSSVDASSSRN